MSTLEKFPNKGASDKPKGAVESVVSDRRAEGVKEELNRFREKQKKSHDVKKKIVIERAKREVDGSVEPEKKEKTKSKSSKEVKNERLANYAEVLKDNKDVSARDFAYSEIFDFDRNVNQFKGENGWLEEYKKMGETDQSLDEFALRKSYEQLTEMRETLVEARSIDLVPNLFPDLKGEEKKTEAKQKSTEISDKSKDFFKANVDVIELVLSGESKNPAEDMKKLELAFRLSVFNGMDLKLLKGSAQDKLVQGFFADLMDDYDQMLAQRKIVKKQIPLMVQMISDDGITEEMWNEKLAKSAEDEVKKMTQEEVKKKEVDVVVSGSTAYTGDVSSMYYADITASKELGADSKIIFEPIAGKPGSFKVKFPSEDGADISYMKVVEKNGQKFFVFERDIAVDHPTGAPEKSIKEAVNSRYLAHTLVEGIKSGKDYLGPSLRDVLKDDQVISLASKLYYPKNLNEYVLQPEDVNVFKSLLLVLSSSKNNRLGEGPYGNLAPINNRIALLQFALSANGGSNAQSIYQNLLKTSPDELRHYSIEQLCMSANIPANSGNFDK